MATIVEDISSTKKRLQIEIPAEILEKEFSESLQNMRQRARIPGFRQGKAPLTIIEKRFGEEIRSELVEKLVPTYFAQAVKEADLSPATMPKLEGNFAFKRNEPLVFTLLVEVRPKLGDLNYTGQKVRDIKVSVDDKEVSDTVISLQKDRAVFDAVDREIREDDLLVIDYIKLDSTGEKELSTAKDQVMDLGNNLTPPGILVSLIGKSKGDIVEVTLPEVVGKEIREDSAKGDKLKITIKEVKEKKLPELDNEFAKDFGHESLDELKAKIREGLLAAKKEDAGKKQKSVLVDELVDSHGFDVPESLAEAELQHLIAKEKYAGNALKQAQTAQTETADAEFAEKLRPQAIRNVKAAIILEEIADRENISVSEMDMKDRIAILASKLQATPDAVINLFMTRDGSLDNLRHNMREEKVLDFLLSRAETVSEV